MGLNSPFLLLPRPGEQSKWKCVYWSKMQFTNESHIWEIFGVNSRGVVWKAHWETMLASVALIKIQSARICCHRNCLYDMPGRSLVLPSSPLKLSFSSLQILMANTLSCGAFQWLCVISTPSHPG